MMECGKDKNPIVACVGDWQQRMTHSWLMLASNSRFELRVQPQKYECDPAIIADAVEFAKQSGEISISNDQRGGQRGYRRGDGYAGSRWGRKKGSPEARAFEGYIVDEALMALAEKGRFFSIVFPPIAASSERKRFGRNRVLSSKRRKTVSMRRKD